MSKVRVGLLLLFPLLAHFAAVTQSALFSAASLLSLASAVLYDGLKQKHYQVWLAYLGLWLALIVLTWFSWVQFALYVPPVVIPFIFFLVFFTTLLPGREPIVTAIGEQSRGPLSADIRRYTRQVTTMWAVLCFLMSGSALLLPFCAPKVVWSFFANFANYAILGVVFLGEFYVRQWKFPDHNHPGFFEYVSIVVQANVGKSHFLPKEHEQSIQMSSKRK